MPITHWPDSSKQRQAFQLALNQIVHLLRIPGGLASKPPLPIYNAGVRDLMINNGLDNSGTLVGWRYFAGGGAQPTAVSGDLDLSANPKLTNVAYGQPVLRALSAIEALENNPSLQAAEFEPRLLRVPGLLLECLWLSPLQTPSPDSADWVLPYHTLISDLNPQQLYRSPDMFQTLQPLARIALAKGRTMRPLQ
jgi:hypothetical protein